MGNKRFTVHFLTSYMTWEDVEAKSKKEAIKKCGDPPYEHDMADFGMFVAIEQEKDEWPKHRNPVNNG